MSKDKLAELREALTEYEMIEFELDEDEVDFGNVEHDSIIPIAYTTLGDNEELEIQVSIDVARNRIEKEDNAEIDVDKLIENDRECRVIEKAKILEQSNVKEVIGSAEYGENPYMISEMNGNFSRDVIVYGYDSNSALDNYVDHGESEHGWDSQEFDLEDFENPYMAKGYFPLEMNDIVIKDLEQDVVDQYLANQGKTMDVGKSKDDELER